MKVWATSDLHVDYPENFHWVANLSPVDYMEDILIVAGDITHELSKLQQVFRILNSKFFKVLFVPGNHDLWVWHSNIPDSMEKFKRVLSLAEAENIQTSPYIAQDLAIVPLFGWYDFTFGQPSASLQLQWSDFEACKWAMPLESITRSFLVMNENHLGIRAKQVISFCHFLPFSSLIPSFVPEQVKQMLPVFGSVEIGKQIQKLKPDIHIYGHSHLNRQVRIEETLFLNNAFGYPSEKRICRKQLLCVYS